jgi:hypothetical protein
MAEAFTIVAAWFVAMRDADMGDEFVVAGNDGAPRLAAVFAIDDGIVVVIRRREARRRRRHAETDMAQGAVEK